MTKGLKKSKQIAGGLLIVLSLCVSSVAACVCAHHAEKVETQISSCHENAESKQETNLDESLPRFDAGDDCDCMQPAPRIFSKSETIKIEKQAAVLPLAKIEIKTIARPVSRRDVRIFEKPFYLSDSFYNIKSPRAPPAA